MKPLIPTTINPRNARPQPTKCLLRITILNKILEKTKVVRIVAPLSILKVDPEIKFKAMYCKIDNEASQIPGMANT